MQGTYCIALHYFSIMSHKSWVSRKPMSWNAGIISLVWHSYSIILSADHSTKLRVAFLPLLLKERNTRNNLQIIHLTRDLNNKRLYNLINLKTDSSVQFSRSVMSNSLRSYGLQHARLSCSIPTPGACSNSCPSSQWCHLTISSSVVPFSSCLQSFPASGSFPVRQFLESGGQSIRVSASASVLPFSEYSGLICFRIDWFDLLAVQGTLKSQFLSTQLSS